MEENLHQRFDIFFISSMMITEKQISVKEIIEKYGNKDSVVVVMSSLGVFPKLGVDVVTHCINKDKISMKMFDSETKKELMSFLN
jgi:NAD-dependent SIR2 family protein deacetylase